MAYRKGNLKREIEKNIEGQMPLPCCEPRLDWVQPDISKLPMWGDAKRVAIDVETRDEHIQELGCGVRRGAYIVGYGVAIEDGPSFYIPTRHKGGDNCDPGHARQYMEDNAKLFSGEVVGANLSYDLDFLWQEKILFPKVKRYRDVQIAEPLIDETRFRYGLDHICGYYGIPGKDESVLRDAASVYYVDPKKGLWQLPGRFAARYTVGDCEKPLQILRRQERIIEERNLGGIWDLECRVLPALLEMRRFGVAIDLNHLQWIEDWTMTEQRALHAKMFEISGLRLAIEDINNANAIAYFLGKTIEGIKISICKNGQPNIDKKLLKGIKHPLGDAVLRSRKLDKLRNTFAASLRRYMVNGRIHASFKQMVGEGNSEDEEKGVRYGRLSCVDPNLQQQPSKDEDYDIAEKAGTLTKEDFHMGKLWRSVYIPEPGMKWAALDYSGQEPRMIVHYASLAKCIGAEEMVAAYLADPNLDVHQRTSVLTGVPRGQAKIIFLGLAYGMGGAKLCHGLGLPTQWVWSKRQGRMLEIAGPEGQGLLDRYNEMVPFLSQLRKMCEKRGGDKGFIRTILGRQLHFPKKKDGTEGYDYLHKALNRIIQGSSADQTKLSVAICYEQGRLLQLQVHDEIDTSVRDEAHAQEYAEIMRHCIPLRVPTKVDVELGDSWGDSM